jgi:2,3-bisphosphoglycerate-dependent phosphoglycerate mutase
LIKFTEQTLVDQPLVEQPLTKQPLTEQTKATELFLLRHGETDWNKARRVQGHIDRPLNEQGFAQARAAANAIRALNIQRPFDFVVVSDLERARQTAQLAAEPLAFDHAINSQWRERNFGVLESMTHEEMLAQQPTIYAGWKSGEPDFQLTEGESLRQFSLRVQMVLQATIEQYAGKRVLVVTHGGVVDMARRIVENAPLSMPRGYEIPNCSVSCVIAQAGQLSLGEWVKADHLEGLI